MRLLVLGLLAACAPKPPEPLEPANAKVEAPAQGEPPQAHDGYVSAKRPDIDISGLVPDFHELLRWPLSAMTHPTLEPHFDIAKVFAEPGVDWIELCNRGAQNRSLGGRFNDEQQYLRGWCHVLQHDIDTALGELTPLLHSTVMDLSSAVRIDIANVIVDSGDSERASHWLKRHSIDDIDTLDTLAADYVEVGRDQDARMINRSVMEMVVTAPDAVACRRVTKDLVLSPAGNREIAIAHLHALTHLSKVPDPTCEELDTAVKCWNAPAFNCKDYLFSQNLDLRLAEVLWIVYQWPEQGASAERWLLVAERALTAVPLPGTEEALLTALEAAERGHPACSKRALDLMEQAVILTSVGVPSAPQKLLDLRKQCIAALERDGRLSAPATAR